MTYQRNFLAVRVFARVLRWGGWLQALPQRLTPPPFRLMQLGSAFWQSCALHVAARLDIATVLGDGTLEAGEIARRVGASPDALARLLRLLVAMEVFEEAAAGGYRNNRLSACLRQDNPRNVRAMILMHGAAAMSRPWFEQLEQGVRGGVPPFRLTHGEDLFDYLDHHGELDTLFAQAMDSLETLAGDGFARDFDWSRFRRVIDVGGSRGRKALAILRCHPRLSALVMDRPTVVAEAERYWAANPQAGSERLAFVAGDMLQAVPPSRDEGDIYLLAAVLHGFGDAHAQVVLQHLAQACRVSGARIALMEMVLPPTQADVLSAAMDMQMFMGTTGRERTLAQWQALFDASGLQLEEVVRLQSFGSILVLKAGTA